MTYVYKFVHSYSNKESISFSKMYHSICRISHRKATDQKFLEHGHPPFCLFCCFFFCDSRALLFTRLINPIFFSDRENLRLGRVMKKKLDIYSPTLRLVCPQKCVKVCSGLLSSFKYGLPGLDTKVGQIGLSLPLDFSLRHNISPIHPK